MAEKSSYTHINGFNEDLQDKLRKVTDERDTAIKEKKELVERIDESNGESGKKIKDLEEKIAELQKQIETLQSDSATLYVAQAASFFQQAICCAVLPGTFKGDSFATIKQMVKYFNGEKLPQGATDDLDEGRRKWAEFRSKLNWTNWDDTYWNYNRLPHEIRAVETLRKIRVSAAHPKIELNIASKLVSKIAGVPQRTEQNIKEFIETLLAKMKHCGLSHHGIKELN